MLQIVNRSSRRAAAKILRNALSKRNLSQHTSKSSYFASKKSSYITAALSGVLLAIGYASINSNQILNDSRRLFSSSKSPSTQQQMKPQITLLSDSQADSKLRQNEESFTMNRNNGVIRYDICQLPSNNPIEDDRSEEVVEVPIKDPVSGKIVNSDWAFWGVYDGHSGWYTSAKLRDDLIGIVVSELSTIYKKSDDGNSRITPTSEQIDIAIKNGFLKLDNQIIYSNVDKALDNLNNKSKAAEYLMPGLSGSCGLLSFYDSKTHILKVAVTGDSRALLGSLNDKNQWTVEALSIDQTGSNLDEAQRIRGEHPNEPSAVTRGRVLGRLEPTRAFGDGKFKWAQKTQEKIHENFFSYPPPSNLKTPPYVTAEPVITTRKISPTKNDFLIIGTDGLYELLTNEEIAGLVIKWAERKNKINDYTSTAFQSIFGSSNPKECTFPTVIDITKDKKLLKPPYRENSQGPKKMLIEDENVSTHLIRNSLTLGTGNKDYGKMLLNIPSPLSRRYRDDLTVVVVFFGENGIVDETKQLKINLEATAGGSKLKSKL